jgi:hypothetical protein
MEEGKIEMVAELMPNKLRLGEECPGVSDQWKKAKLKWSQN